MSRMAAGINIGTGDEQNFSYIMAMNRMEKYMVFTLSTQAKP